ncbi:MAG TPA: AAA family ATPase [Pyrinomonadaceae bacterium]|nr:AAA family ATPase [Pyrinomonadaceae bacterium]
MIYGSATENKIDEVLSACLNHGGESIVVLSGVAGTGKTLISLVAAQRLCGHPLFVRQIQFHPSYTYEDFVEGLRPTSAGAFQTKAGVFLELNTQAQHDINNRYCLLIEEFSRANVPAVLGELMTYIEYRDRVFYTPLSEIPLRVAPNLTILATMNPRDRSALEIDDALIRRLRIISCPPDTGQLREMLARSLTGSEQAKEQIILGLVRLFEECERRHKATYHDLMPFGHGIFAGVRTADDLRMLWKERIRFLLKRPLVLPHPFYDTIEELYVWKDAAQPVVEAPQRNEPTGPLTPATDADSPTG